MNQNIAEFCYVCFECNKNLKDLLKSAEECLELIAKLRVCVSEVDWSYHKKLLLCDKCIRKLNKAHEFKKQCIQSAETLKLYLCEIEKSSDKRKIEKKEEPLVLQYLNLMKDDKSVKKLPPPLLLKYKPKEVATPTPPPPQPVYPAITKIVLTNQNNSFQNVFLNLLPQNATNKTNKANAKTEPNKGALYSFSKVLHIPTKKDTVKKQETEVVSKLMTETKTEEVSVEIDPLDFNMETAEKSESKPLQMANNNFRPILPKLNENYDYTNEEKMEFFNSGHFLLQDFEKHNRFYCEKCMVRFESTKYLHQHIKQVHSSQYPYKCDYCDMEFAAKEVFRNHMTRHYNDSSDLMNNSITLIDFKTNNPKINDLVTQAQTEEVTTNIITPTTTTTITTTTIKDDSVDEEEVACNECDRVFASYQGLIRHKAKVHKSYKRKKYFVKGMKNAKCDICNRMFSTQSYLTLHRKLHDRKGGDYRRRVFRQKSEDNQITEVDVFDDSDAEMCEDEKVEEVSREDANSISVEMEHTSKENDNG